MRLLRYEDLRDKKIPWSKQYLRKLEAAGRFPRRIYLGKATVAWDERKMSKTPCGASAGGSRMTPKRATTNGSGDNLTSPPPVAAATPADGEFRSHDPFEDLASIRLGQDF